MPWLTFSPDLSCLAYHFQVRESLHPLRFPNKFRQPPLLLLWRNLLPNFLHILKLVSAQLIPSHTQFALHSPPLTEGVSLVWWECFHHVTPLVQKWSQFQDCSLDRAFCDLGFWYYPLPANRQVITIYESYWHYWKWGTGMRGGRESHKIGWVVRIKIDSLDSTAGDRFYQCQAQPGVVWWDVMHVMQTMQEILKCYYITLGTGVRLQENNEIKPTRQSNPIQQ